MTKKQLRDAYKFQCKCKYYGILFAYLCDFSVKVYVLYFIGGIWISFAGVVVDMVAKSYTLKQMKFRSRGYYAKRTKSRSKQNKKTIKRNKRKN